MRLVHPGVRRRHCRNYPLRPPGPSERCLASAPYLEPAELSPPLSPLSHSVTLSFPSPPFRLPLSSSSTFVPTFPSLSLAGLPETQPTNQPTRPTTRPPTLPNPSPSPPSPRRPPLVPTISLSAPTFSPRSCGGAGVQSSQRL